MARAKSICNQPGCYEYAVNEGRCASHQRPSTWGSSTRTSPQGWARKRKRVLYRARYRCRICGRRATVVDHIRAQAFGGDDQLPNLQALCVSCHNAKTQDEARVGRLVTRMSADERAAEITKLVARWS